MQAYSSVSDYFCQRQLVVQLKKLEHNMLHGSGTHLDREYLLLLLTPADPLEQNSTLNCISWGNIFYKSKRKKPNTKTDVGVNASSW